MQMPERIRAKNKPPVIHPPTWPYIVAGLSGIAVGIVMLVVGGGKATQKEFEQNDTGWEEDGLEDLERDFEKFEKDMYRRRE